jgi:PIN domain nuclease of toxin-antitoxin system
MRHLVDAHSLIWALDDPRKLGIRAVAVLEDPANDLIVSAGTIWELSIKVGWESSLCPCRTAHGWKKP